MKTNSMAVLFTRYALAVAFLSAVADRFGLWGPPGSTNVAWGNYPKFLEYTALLTPWAPKNLLPVVGGAATLLEILLAVGLIIGFRIKETSFCSAVLLLSFALSMSFTIGIKAPLDYSVFSASAAAFLLYSTQTKK